ncbi:MAG TPA: hypothetical protein VNM47_04480 [Terriglobia bacterium]|nr:hypothetical protein [Terriglobia bacterium]
MTRMGCGGGRRLIGLAVTVLASIVLVGLPITARGQEIRVRFLNARTGRPVTYEAAQMWVESCKLCVLTAPADNKKGTATFLYTGDSIKAIWPPKTKESRYFPTELTISPWPIKIAVAPIVAAGICWDTGSGGEGPWYPISEILQHGAVSENHCGKATASPKPGEWILFIKPIPAWKRILGGFSE